MAAAAVEGGACTEHYGFFLKQNGYVVFLVVEFEEAAGK
jgi:hypothetical protein